MTDQRNDDVPVLETRIPEFHHVDGLEYGAHVSANGWCGYYVRPVGCETYGIARMTPAADELPEPEDGETQWEAVVRCVREEMC